jgi:hypothetical protein
MPLLVRPSGCSKAGPPSGLAIGPGHLRRTAHRPGDLAGGAVRAPGHLARPRIVPTLLREVLGLRLPAGSRLASPTIAHPGTPPFPHGGRVSCTEVLGSRRRPMPPWTTGWLGGLRDEQTAPLRPPLVYGRGVSKVHQLSAVRSSKVDIWDFTIPQVRGLAGPARAGPPWLSRHVLCESRHPMPAAAQLWILNTPAWGVIRGPSGTHCAKKGCESRTGGSTGSCAIRN